MGPRLRSSGVTLLAWMGAEGAMRACHWEALAWFEVVALSHDEGEEGYLRPLLSPWPQAHDELVVKEGALPALMGAEALFLESAHLGSVTN